jgi:hypothetical protein
MGSNETERRRKDEIFQDNIDFGHDDIPDYL